MAENQYYETVVNQQAKLVFLAETAGNEQYVQAFTEAPAEEKHGVGGDADLCAFDLFCLFTFEIIMERTVFTR